MRQCLFLEINVKVNIYFRNGYRYALHLFRQKVSISLQ